MDLDPGTIIYLIVLVGGLLATAVQRDRSQRKLEERRRNAPPPRPRPPSPFDEPSLDRRWDVEPEAEPRPRVPRPAPPAPRASQPKPPPKSRPQPLSDRRRGSKEDVVQHLLRHDQARSRAEATREARFLMTRFPPSAPVLAAHVQRSTFRRKHAGALRKMLRTKNQLRDLVLLAEILGPPVSQRESMAPAERR